MNQLLQEWVDVPLPSSVKERVQLGIALLDARGPRDWRRRIDPRQLFIQDGRRCILGQVFGGYETGLQQLFLPLMSRERSLEGARHGFDAFTLAETDALNIAWRNALINDFSNRMRLRQAKET